MLENFRANVLNTKLGDFVKLGLHFMTVWINIHLMYGPEGNS